MSVGRSELFLGDWRGNRGMGEIETWSWNAELGERSFDAIALVEKRHGSAQVLCRSAPVGGYANVVFKCAADALFNLIRFERVEQLARYDAEDFIHEAPRFASAESAGLGARESVGEGALQQPGGGAPIVGRCLLHGAQRADLRIVLAISELLGECRIAAAFAFDRGHGTADVFCCFAKSASAGDQRADFATFTLVENSGPASAVVFRAFGWRRGCVWNSFGKGFGLHGYLGSREAVVGGGADLCGCDWCPGRPAR